MVNIVTKKPHITSKEVDKVDVKKSRLLTYNYMKDTISAKKTQS